MKKLTAVLMKNRGHKKYKSHLQCMKITESTIRIIHRASKMYLGSSPQCISGVCMGFTTEMTIWFVPEQSPGKNKILAANVGTTKNSTVTIYRCPKIKTFQWYCLLMWLLVLHADMKKQGFNDQYMLF